MYQYKKILVTGKVQGVFFRVSAKEQADKLNLIGFITNQTDGSVYIETYGDTKDINQFISWCGQGPSVAKVSEVQAESISKFSRPVNGSFSITA